MYEQIDHTFSIGENLWVFTGVTAASTLVNSWHIWEKPKWCRGVFMTGISGGSGGGGGGASAAGVAGGGGGGGGNGCVTTVFYPAIFLPDRLFLKTGTGGTGGTGQVQGGAVATAGITGSGSFICSDPQLTPAFVYLGTNSGANGGGAGSGATIGAGGGVISASSASSVLFSNFGIPTFVATTAGGSGGSAAVGVTVGQGTAAANWFCTPGAGGGGVNAGTTTFAGGDVGQNIFVTPIPGGLAGGGDGILGYTKLFDQIFPYFTTGGSGGGANTSTGIGGKGGDGGYGSGGGGGGASNGAASRGGAGGRGGPGIIFIQAI